MREFFAYPKGGRSSFTCVDLAPFCARAALDLAAPDEPALAVELGESHASLESFVAAQNLAAILAARRDVAFAVLHSCNGDL